jgi:hypothetical protein
MKYKMKKRNISFYVGLTAIVVSVATLSFISWSIKTDVCKGNNIITIYHDIKYLNDKVHIKTRVTSVKYGTIGVRDHTVSDDANLSELKAEADRWARNKVRKIKMLYNDQCITIRGDL